LYFHRIIIYYSKYNDYTVKIYKFPAATTEAGWFYIHKEVEVMPFYENSSENAMKDDEVDFQDIMNIMNMLDSFAESEEGRLRLRVADNPKAKTEKTYHHGRCDVGSPWAKGTPFDELSCQ
jgi:hypothetical protein